MNVLLRATPFILSGSFFFCCGRILYWWISSFSSWRLREHLKIFSPLFLEIIFFLIIIAFGINTGCFKKVFSQIPKKIWIFLGVIVAGGMIVCVLIVPREHRIYYDEDIYENIAQNIACLKGTGTHSSEGYLKGLSSVWQRFIGRAGMCNEGRNEYGEYHCYRLEYNKEPNAWPYLLSVVFRLVGIHESAAFVTNNIIFCFSIIIVFFTGYLLFKSYFTGIIAALFFALTPEVLIWSNTVAVEPSASFFSGLSLLSVLLFIKTRETKSLFLSIVLTAFAVQFRPESMMILAVNGIAILFFAADELKKGRFYLFASIFFALILPHLVHLYAVKDMGWGSTGAKFSLDYLEENLRVNTLFYLKNLRFPLLFTLFFIVGIPLTATQRATTRSRFLLKQKALIVVWFLLFWGIFIFFYAGSYNYGADVRFSLLSSIPVALLAGHGASGFSELLRKKFSHAQVNAIVVILILLFFMPFLPFLRAITQEAWGARADHRFAKEMAKALPPDALVLTHNPNMFLLWGKNAAQASLATEHRTYFKGLFRRYRGGLYFHYNFWCNVPDTLQNSFCTNILERFKCTPVMSFKEKHYNYILYRVEKKEWR